ncbi:MAG: membrane protein insertase YidC [Planctomycetes bacterium]|nr:membrane protein insertase YidC [Planctomycetota bacterium]
MDKRTLLFIALSVLIWFLYMHFIMPMFAPKEPPASEGPPVITGTAAAPASTGGPAITSPPVSVTGEAKALPRRTDIPLVKKVVENDYLKAVFTNQGAALESLVLKKYCATKCTDELKLLNAFQPGQYSLGLNMGDSHELESVNWEIIEERPDVVVFRYTTGPGLVISKSFSLQKYNYGFDYKIDIENTAEVSSTVSFIIGGASGISAEQDDHQDLFGVRGYTNPEHSKWYLSEDAPLRKLADPMADQTKKPFRLARGDDNVFWTGLVNKYFAAILIPLAPEAITRYNFGLLGSDNIASNLQTVEMTINPHQSQSIEMLFYAGPKKAGELAEFPDYGLDKLLDYGWFGFFSKILLFILKLFYSIFGNYGVAIILLTLIIKVLLFPLSRKSQVSMFRLQKLQPKVKALEIQYKNDRQKLGMEQMKLWKEHGVNPMSGCLPMFLQIPILFGLYWGLSLAIELRQSPFMLWITDLSQPDQMFKLPTTILGVTHFHFLPIVMTISWLVQSLTQPKSPDPQTRQQQKMFVLMPLIFGLMFYNVASGLTLYWFTSTLLGIIEQQVIKRFYLK